MLLIFFSFSKSVLSLLAVCILYFICRRSSESAGMSRAASNINADVVVMGRCAFSILFEYKEIENIPFVRKKSEFFDCYFARTTGEPPNMPLMGILSSAASICVTFSLVRTISAAPKFSFSRHRRRVPGIVMFSHICCCAFYRAVRIGNNSGDRALLTGSAATLVAGG